MHVQSILMEKKLFFSTFLKIKNILLLLFSTLQFLAAETDYREQEWGIGALFRTAQIPYTAKDKTTNDFMPLLFFENKYLFLHGLESGVKVFDTTQWRFSAISRLRYVDTPQEDQNISEEISPDVGLQLRYKLSNNQFIDLEGMQDNHGRFFSNITYSGLFKNSRLTYKPYAQLRWSSEKFNSFYYGVDKEHVDAGLNGSLGIEFKYQIVSNLYFLAKLQGRYLGNSIVKSHFIEDKFETEASFGLAFFNTSENNNKPLLSTTPYLRLAYGCATPSDLDEILVGKGEKDDAHNHMYSLFYGYPLTNELFGLPIDFYLTPGIVSHQASQTQKQAQEYILAIKAYYTFPTTWRIRLGLAEGISYENHITYIEATEFKMKKYKTNNVLNYLDLSIDINIGDIFSPKLNKLWLGAAVHHRSAIYESSSLFGHVRGGSNYNTVYLQWHF